MKRTSLRHRWTNIRRAFSLIELIAALVILGLMMGILAMSFQGTLSRIRQRGEIEELKLFDQQVRSRVLRHGTPLEVTFDQNTKQLRVAAQSPTSDRSELTMSLNSVTKSWMASRNKAQGLELQYDRFGCSTYGVKRSLQQADPTWTICLGTSGQFLVDVTEEELTSLKEILK